MSVSRKSKKNIKKSCVVKKQNKKTQKNMRKMKGGTHDDIRKYLNDNFESIYGENPFSNNASNTDRLKNEMIEDVMNAINVISKKVKVIDSIQDFNNFIIEYYENQLLVQMLGVPIVEYFKKSIQNQ